MSLINIAEINKCYGNVTLKVSSENGIKDGEYTFANCDKNKNNTWNCDCNNLSNVILESGNETNNVYDIIVEYYIAPDKNDDNKRTYRHNNIKLSPEEKVKEPVKLPTFNDGWIIGIIIGGVFGGILLLIVGIIYWLFRGEKEDEHIIKPRIKRNDNKTLNQIRNNIK